MRRGKLVIRLDSDLCTGDGGVYNSLVDTEVCFDRYGFPFIPAKRLRGCLRECAQELEDWGLLEGFTPSDLFGTEGRGDEETFRSTTVRIRNAILEEKEELKEYLKKYPDHAIFHPQHILEHYTALRNQTAIDDATGTADETTLRTVRVVVKGIEFTAQVIIETCPNEEAIEEVLEKCCLVFRHMGIARTRGLGEVHVRYQPEPNESSDQEGTRDRGETDAMDASGASGPDRSAQGRYSFSYVLETLDPVICKSVHSGEAETLDYIEGSKIYGMLLEQARLEGCREELLKRELLCSNAYISDGEHRYTEVPMSLYAVKNSKTDLRDKLHDLNNACEAAENVLSETHQPTQLSAIRHAYLYETANGKYRKMDVATGQHYHHKRDEDKGVGRASTVEGATALYQIEAIEPGQKFMGMVSGDPVAVKKAYDLLNKAREMHIGYGRNSEYGTVRILDNSLTWKMGPGSVITVNAGDKFAVRLISPAIVYNRRATYSTSLPDLTDEITTALDCEAQEVRNFTQTTTVGGFNVTWGMRKPTVEAFAAGSVVVFEACKSGSLALYDDLRIGERRTEGYGEIQVQKLTENENLYKRVYEDEAEDGNAPETLDLSDSVLAQKLAEELFDTFADWRAGVSAEKFSKAHMQESDFRGCAKAVVSNLILLTEDARKQGQTASKGRFEFVKEGSDKRFLGKDGPKASKGAVACKILSEVEKDCEQLYNSFTREQYGITGMPDTFSDERTFRYLIHYLNGLKRALRKTELRG